MEQIKPKAAPVPVCGPYNLYREMDDKRKSFCIMDDNSIHIRSYKKEKD